MLPPRQNLLAYAIPIARGLVLGGLLPREAEQLRAPFTGANFTHEPL